jgi:hypothetical protein
MNLDPTGSPRHEQTVAVAFENHYSTGFGAAAWGPRTEGNNRQERHK